MTLAPERLNALKNQHGMDADEAQELFAHIAGLEAAMESAITLIETDSPRLALVTLKAALLPE